MPQENKDIEATTITKLLFNFDNYVYYAPNKRDVKVLYKWAEYFSTFTVVGTAQEKLAQYPISNLYVSATPNMKDDILKTLRKIKLRNRMMQIGMNYQIYGIAFAVPMFPVKKVIKCPACGKKYALVDLAKYGRKLYSFDGGKFYYTCKNEKCKQHKIHKEFEVIDTQVQDISKMKIAVWSPYQMRPVRNEITSETQWIFKIPPTTAKLIQEKDHFILCTTPQIYIDAVFAGAATEIRINDDSVFVFEAPTRRIAGMPIPPMVRAFRSLAMDEAYNAANKIISNEMLVPLRMLFPVERGAIGHRPIQATIGMSSFKGHVLDELAAWRKDKAYVPFMPVEIGSKDFWGTGKLLVLHEQLRHNTQDILAQIGVPLEFIYGGATWSRQNVSSIILENTFKAICDLFQELLDWVSDKINEYKGLSEKCSIRLRSPRLVEAMAENSYIKDGMDKGDISKATYYDRYNVDYEGEKPIVEREASDIKKGWEKRGEHEALAIVAGEKIKRQFAKQIRTDERTEQVKDGLAMAAIKADDAIQQIQMQKAFLNLNVEAQSYLMRLTEDSQGRMMDKQVKYQKELMKVQDQIGYKNLKRQNRSQLRMMAEQLKIQVKGIKAQALAEQDTQETLEEIAAEKDRFRLINTGASNLTPEEEQNINTFLPDQQTEMLYRKGKRIELDDFIKGLPSEQQEQIGSLEEDEKYRQVDIMKQQTEEQSPEEDKQKKEEQPDEKEDGDAIRDAVDIWKRTPEGEKRSIWEAELIKEDSDKYAKVKNLAELELIRGYVTQIINAEPGDERSVFKKIQQKNPSLFDTVHDETKKQIVLLAQAMEYAKELYKFRSNPDKQQIIISGLTDEAPDEFKVMVLKYYGMLLNHDLENKQLIAMMKIKASELENNQKIRVLEIASNLKAMDQKARKEHLATYAHEDPAFYEKIMTEMSKIE